MFYKFANFFQIASELNRLNSFEERLSMTTQILNKVTPFSPDQLSAAAASLYYKLVAADKYKPTMKFNGQITLIRAIDNYVELGNDYGLSEVSINIVAIFFLIIY